jgi:hypothetical protein
MNKAKLKRIRKDLDKTFQSGRYWEWLHFLEKEGLKSQYSQQWAEAWKKLVQRSYRLPKHFSEFLDQVNSFKQLPAFPDLTLLLLLKEQRDGQDVQAELAALTGLSPQGNVFRERALSWDESLVKKEKIEGILTDLISRPEHIEKKQYDRLALLNEGSFLTDLIRELGEGIKKLRKGTGLTGIKKSRTQTMIRALQDADRLIEEVAPKCPPNLFTILIYPHLTQLAHFLKITSEKEPHVLMGRIISALPFLFDRLAGDKAQKIKSDLLGFSHSPISAKELFALAEEVSKADFEGKVRLLGRVRSLVQQKASDDLIALFENLYRDILAGVREKAAQLDGRQKKELSQLLSPVIQHDLDLLWEREEFYGDLSHLGDWMKAVGEAGCLDPKLALLALITAEKGKDRRLKETAHQVLTGPEKPKPEDLQWVLNFLDEEIIPYVGLLKPVTEFFSQDQDFVLHILRYLKNRLDFLMVIGSTPTVRGVDLFNQPFEDSFFSEGSKEILTLTRSQLSILKEDPVFSPTYAYLQCFPENVFTAIGYTKYLNLIYQGQKSLVPILDHLLTLNHEIAALEETAPPEILDSGIFFLLNTKQKTVLTFIHEQVEALKEVPLQKIKDVIPIIEQEMSPKDQGAFLIRFSNILSNRIKEGEKEAAPLKNSLLDRLARLKRKF